MMENECFNCEVRGRERQTLRWDYVILSSMRYVQRLAPTKAAGKLLHLHKYAKLFLCTLGPASNEFGYYEQPVNYSFSEIITITSDWLILKIVGCNEYRL